MHHCKILCLVVFITPLLSFDVIAADTVWVNDAVPTGAWVGAAGGDGWQWVGSNPAPFSGAAAHQSNLAAGIHYHYFSGASATLAVNPGETLITHVFLDPVNVPQEIMLQWYDGASWAHAAYWGANLIRWGTDGTASQRSMGALPPAGQWVRLEVPASLVGLEGRTLLGMNFLLYDGRATWDFSGKSSESSPPPADTTPPAVAITAPANNATVSGSAITVSTSASDNVGVAGVQFKLDGANLGAEDNSAPFGIGWNTTSTSNGSHTLTAVARDAAGNQTTSGPVTVTVSNGAPADTIWFNDALPTGAWPGAAGGDSWQWVSGNPAPFSGAAAHQSRLVAGIHYHYFSGASATLTVNPGDTLVNYVFLDSANLPQEIMLQWFDGASWQHAAYWGANLIRWGTDGTASQRPMGALPPAGQWVRLEVPANWVGLEGQTLAGMNFILYGGRATWDYSGKSSSQPMVWVEDSVPAGAWTGTFGGDQWTWVSSNPTPYSGARAHQSALAGGAHYHYFAGASSTLQVTPGDTLFTYAFLDPANPPQQVLMQWFDGSSWAHSAYWGTKFISWGTDGTPSQQPMGLLPPPGRWVRLEVPARLVGLEGKTLSGLNFALYGGRATWDYSGRQPTTHPSWLADANSVHYPDLQTLPPTDVQIQRNTTTGQRFLRFSNWIANRGAGHIEIAPVNNADGTTDGHQRLFSHDSNGNWYLVSSTFVGKFIFHPEHDHWHFEDFARYQLRNTAADGSIGGAILVESTKVSSCLLDSSMVEPGLSHAQSQSYKECTQTKPQGLSVGWADVYTWDLPGQDLDISQVADGDYWLLSTADPTNLLNEGGGAESNNTAALKIRIQGQSVTVLQ